MSFLTLGCLLLGACTQDTGVSTTLSPEDVLKKSTMATQTLESAQFTVKGEFDSAAQTRVVSGTYTMDGILQNAGKQLRFQFDTNANIEQAARQSTLSATLEIVQVAQDELYFNVRSLTSQPSGAFFNEQITNALAGRWWLLPSADASPLPEAVTPDPMLLSAQAQVVDVTKDLGLQAINGRESFHYRIALDREKLLTFLKASAKEHNADFDERKAQELVENIEASGELWIDTETFYINKMIWVISSLNTETGTLSFTADITLRNHNAAPDILPPEHAVPFSLSALFSTPFNIPPDIDLNIEEFDADTEVQLNEMIDSLSSP